MAPTVLRAVGKARQLGQEQDLDGSVGPLDGPFQVGRVGTDGPGVDAEGRGGRHHRLGQELLPPVVTQAQWHSSERLTGLVQQDGRAQRFEHAGLGGGDGHGPSGDASRGKVHEHGQPGTDQRTVREPRPEGQLGVVGLPALVAEPRFPCEVGVVVSPRCV